MTGTRGGGERRRGIGAGVALVVLLVGVEITLAAAFALQQEPRNTAGEVLDNRADLISEAVTAEARRYTDAVRTVAAAASTVDPLDSAQFSSIAGPLREMHLAGATSVAFVVPASDEEVAPAQARWRARGEPQLALVPQGRGREHLFAVLHARVNDNFQPGKLGVDISQLPAPTRALADARRTDDVGVSDTYQFLFEKRMPPNQRQNSFCLAAPVFAAKSSPDAGSFRGWIVLGLHGEDFGKAILDRASQGLADVTLRAENSSGSQVRVASVHSSTTGPRDLRRELIVAVVQRRWHLDIEATAAALPGGSSPLPMTVTAGGIALTLMLSMLVLTTSSGRARAQAQHAKAAAELAAVAQELEEAREELLAARGEEDPPPAQDAVSRSASPGRSRPPASE